MSVAAAVSVPAADTMAEDLRALSHVSAHEAAAAAVQPMCASIVRLLLQDVLSLAAAVVQEEIACLVAVVEAAAAAEEATTVAEAAQAGRINQQLFPEVARKVEAVTEELQLIPFPESMVLQAVLDLEEAVVQRNRVPKAEAQMP
jgi:hypothetical protein